MPEPTTELFDIDWRETSFVPAGGGDNPPARIAFWKDAPGLTDEEIEEILLETERSEVPAMMTKRSDVEAHVTRLAKTQYPDVGEAAGRARIWAQRPDLRDAHAAAPVAEIPTPREPASLEKGAPALQKRDAAVKDLRKIYPEKSRTELRLMALEEDPSIYEEYRRLQGS